MATCEYDTGSMCGCRPACDEPATVAVTIAVPCYGPITRPMCARHVGPMRGRAYPHTVTVELLRAAVSA